MDVLTYHLFNRGIKKRKIFHYESDYARFMKMVEEYSEIIGIIFYGLSLMQNHFHLIPSVGTEMRKITDFMHRLGTGYAMYYNRKYDSSGHVFQGTYGRSSREKLWNVLRTVRYIHQNPVELSKSSNWQAATDFMMRYKWSSYRHYFEAHPPKWLDVEGVLKYFHQDLSMFKAYMESPDSRLDLPQKKRK